MKKRILSVAAALALLFGPMSIQPANAQVMIQEKEEKEVEEEKVEEEFENTNMEIDYKFDDKTKLDDQGLEAPMTPGKAGITIDRYAPLGGEIFVLACLGGAYLLGKRRKEE